MFISTAIPQVSVPTTTTVGTPATPAAPTGALAQAPRAGDLAAFHHEALNNAALLCAAPAAPAPPVVANGQLSGPSAGNGQVSLASGSGQVQVNVAGPGGVQVNGSGSGNFMFQGARGNANGNLTVGPNGAIDGSFAGSGVVGSRIEGQGQVTVTGLPLGTSVNAAGNGFAGSGARVEVGAFNNPASAPTPGQNAGPSAPAQVQLPNNGSGVNVNGQIAGFVGNEAQATVSARLNTPIGSVGNTTTVRASQGAGGDLGGQLTVNNNQATVGLGGGFEVGSSVGGSSTNTVATPNGSSVSNTSIVSVGGSSAEARVGASRDNNAGTTSVGGTLALPIPGTPLTAGGGTNITVNDRDVRVVGNLVTPGGGDLAAAGLQAAPAVINVARQVPAQVAASVPATYTAVGSSVSGGGAAVSNAGVNNIVAGAQQGGVGGTLQQVGGVAQVVTGEGVRVVGQGMQRVGNAGSAVVEFLTPWWMR